MYCSIAALLIIVGCASSSNNKTNSTDFENLITLQKPGDQPYQSSKVYIDSVKNITTEQGSSLLIHGTFPDACTHLEEVSHHIENDSLYLEFKAWRNPETMCSQVLTPFSFIYDNLSKQDIASHTAVIINGISYKF